MNKMPIEIIKKFNLKEISGNIFNAQMYHYKDNIYFVYINGCIRILALGLDGKLGYKEFPAEVTMAFVPEAIDLLMMNIVNEVGQGVFLETKNYIDHRPVKSKKPFFKGMSMHQKVTGIFLLLALLCLILRLVTFDKAWQLPFWIFVIFGWVGNLTFKRKN